LTLGVTQTSGLTLNPFNGLLDAIRIYGQVQPLEALERTRRLDIGQVPEPSSLALALLAAAGATVFVARRRKSA
jgi:hypothetical protein